MRPINNTCHLSNVAPAEEVPVRSAVLETRGVSFVWLEKSMPQARVRTAYGWPFQSPAVQDSTTATEIPDLEIRSLDLSIQELREPRSQATRA